MQVALEQRSIESNLTGEEVTFKLDSESPFIFELIRNKIYSDPIGSICREICDNARDAHREVGKQDKPIEIFLPGDYLTIKDYGPGLSEERVKQIYTIYGKSSKRSDNSQGGGFGIGAKTPFAYTDQFEIETVHDQMKYCWLSYLDESNIGKLKLVSQQETLEENYTAIRIPVKYNDRDRFTRKIVYYTKNYYLAGDATPHYIGQPQDIHKHNTMSPTRTWAIFDKMNYDSSYNVVLNGIPYDADNIYLPEGCVLIFNIGDLDISGTREALQYTTKTNEKLKAAQAILDSEIIEMLNKDCDNLEITQFLDLIKKFKCKPQEWTYKGQKFTYPGKQFIRIRHSNRRGRRLQDDLTTNPGKCPIYTYEADSWDQVPQYIRQKIRKVTSELHGDIILCRPDHPLLTFFPHTDINTVKLNLYVKKDKDQIARDKELLLAYDVKQDRLVEIPYKTTEEIIYAVTDVIRKNQTNFDFKFRYGSLPTIVLSKASERKLRGNWISYDDYIKRELWNKYTDVQLQEIVDCKESSDHYNCIEFMKDDPQFYFFEWNKQYKFEKWQWTLIEAKFQGKFKAINFTKYPLLEIIFTRSRYHYLNDKEQELILDYVRSCNATTLTV